MIKNKAFSAAAIFMSCAVIVGGTAARANVTTAPPEADVILNTAKTVASDIPITVGMAGESRIRDNRRSIGVYIDGAKYSGNAFLYKDTTYVGFRAFSVALADAEVSWNPTTETATAKINGNTVNATKGGEYVTANGRYFWARTGIIIDSGTMYVPIRALCSAFSATLTWDGGTYTVSVKRGSGKVQTGSAYYDSDEVYWLSKIIHAESRGESLTGKIAVGNVVLNRVKSKDYPNTIYGVIFDKKYGVQFSPVADGSIHLEPDADSVIAAKLCLEGYTVSDKILFFINTGIATNAWVTTARPHEVTIGNHDFYA